MTSGEVVAGGPNDSQRRFQNDLSIENINRVLGADDYDGDGLQEVYLALTDGSAYLHAYMHADGNIQYANYQSQTQVIEFLTANGYGPETWADWFPDRQESPSKTADVIDPLDGGGAAAADLFQMFAAGDTMLELDAGSAIQAMPIWPFDPGYPLVPLAPIDAGATIYEFA